MIIKLSDYDGKSRVAVLAKTEEEKNKFLNRDLNVLFINGCFAEIYPEKVSFKISEKEKELFLQSCSHDVFEIDSFGNAYKYYDNCSVDNGVLVTNKCNSNCIMCPTPETIRKNGNSYSARQLIEVIKHFPKDAPHITITGGEPFLIGEDLFEVLDYFKANFPYTQFLLLTNGRVFFSPQYAERFNKTAPENIQIGIPIHGYNSETHDSITQAEGSFIQTIKGIENLISYGFKVELRVVVSQLNASFVTEICGLIAQKFKKALCVKIIGLEMTGNAAKNKEKVWIDYSEAFNKSVKGINKLIEAGIDVGIYNFPLCTVDRAYWNICEKSISDYKIRFSDECGSCKLKDACGGIFSGTIRLAKNNLKPIGEL